MVGLSEEEYMTMTAYGKYLDDMSMSELKAFALTVLKKPVDRNMVISGKIPFVGIVKKENLVQRLMVEQYGMDKMRLWVQKRVA